MAPLFTDRAAKRVVLFLILYIFVLVQQFIVILVRGLNVFMCLCVCADGGSSILVESSTDNPDTCEGTYFGMKEYCESIKWTHQFPLVRQDDAFEKMAFRTSRYAFLRHCLEFVLFNCNNRYLSRVTASVVRTVISGGPGVQITLDFGSVTYRLNVMQNEQSTQLTAEEEKLAKLKPFMNLQNCKTTEKR